VTKLIFVFAPVFMHRFMLWPPWSAKAESWRKRKCLEFDRTGNCAIRSADPKTVP